MVTTSTTMMMMMMMIVQITRLNALQICLPFRFSFKKKPSATSRECAEAIEGLSIALKANLKQPFSFCRFKVKHFLSFV